MNCDKCHEEKLWGEKIEMTVGKSGFVIPRVWKKQLFIIGSQGLWWQLIFDGGSLCGPSKKQYSSKCKWLNKTRLRVYDAKGYIGAVIYWNYVQKVKVVYTFEGG